MSNVLREGVRLLAVDLVLTTFFFLESVEDGLTNIFITKTSPYKRYPRFSTGSQSIRTQVNSYSFWSIRTQNFGQLVLIWSIGTHVWSVRTHFGQFVLILVNSYSNSNEYELTKMSTN